MSFTPREERFIADFAEKLQQRIEEEGGQLMPEASDVKKVDFHDIAKQFMIVIKEFQSLIHINQPTKIDGLITWDSKRQHIITALSVQFRTIFDPIKAIEPKAKSAFWSGLGRKGAEAFGLNLEKTIAGSMLEWSNNHLIELIAPHAFTTADVIDTTTMIGIWQAMSDTYAHNTTENTNVYLFNGQSNSQSVFWNVELNRLRILQQQQTIKKIFIHTLTPSALDRYLELKHQAEGGADPKTIETNMNDLFKNPCHWIAHDLDAEDSPLTLLVPGGQIRYATIKKIGSLWRELGATRVAIDTDDNPATRYDKTLNAIEEMMTHPDPSMPSDDPTNKKRLQLSLIKLKILKHRMDKDTTTPPDIIKIFEMRIDALIKKITTPSPAHLDGEAMGPSRLKS